MTSVGEYMLRIHFTGDDLARTRVAPAANPFWEMVFSRLRLAEQDPPAVLRPWPDRLRPQHARSSLVCAG